MKQIFDYKVLFFFFSLVLVSCQPPKEAPREVIPVNDISGFLGQWSFDIGKNQVGWLEVKQENGYVDASLLWGGGSVLPVPYVFMANGKLIVGRDTRKIVRTKDENGNVTGKAKRGDCHFNPSGKILHPVVHMHVFNEKGEIYLQHRSLNKKVTQGFSCITL